MPFADIMCIDGNNVDGLIEKYVEETQRKGSAIVIVDEPNATAYAVVGGRTYRNSSSIPREFKQVIIPNKTETYGLTESGLHNTYSGEVPDIEVAVDANKGPGEISVTLHGATAIRYLHDKDIDVLNCRIPKI